GGAFANGVKQPQTLLNDLLFIQHFTAQGREGRAQCLRLLHHKLRRAAVGGDIGQTACGDHSTANGELLAEDNVQPRLLFWQAEGGNVLNAQSDIVRFLQLQIAKPVRLIKKKTQDLLQHNVVNVVDIQDHVGTDGRGQQRTECRKQSF